MPASLRRSHGASKGLRSPSNLPLPALALASFRRRPPGPPPTEWDGGPGVTVGPLPYCLLRGQDRRQQFVADKDFNGSDGRELHGRILQLCFNAWVVTFAAQRHRPSQMERDFGAIH